MTKKDKAILAEALTRLCADIAVISNLFSDDEPRTRGQPPNEQQQPAEDNAATEPAATEPKMTDSPPPKPPAPVTYEQVRFVLAEKSRTGYRAEVKSLLTKHGVKQLSDADPAIYAELLSEAEEIGNG